MACGIAQSELACTTKSTWNLIPANFPSGQITLSCNSGYTVMGGGAECIDYGNWYGRMTKSFPYQNGWAATCKRYDFNGSTNNDGAQIIKVMYVRCCQKIYPPAPPTNVLITAGRSSATLNFAASTKGSSGSSIAHYTASCTASGQTTRTATGTSSPLTVKNLTGGVPYQCTLTATDGDGLTSIASASTPVTPAKKSSLTPILMLLLD